MTFPSNPNSGLTVDWAHLEQVTESNQDFQKELLHSFWQDAHAHLALIQSRLTAADFIGVAEAAHYLKGCSANLGLVSVTQTAMQLEAQANQQTVAAMHTTVARLQTLLNHLPALYEARYGLAFQPSEVS